MENKLTVLAVVALLTVSVSVLVKVVPKLFSGEYFKNDVALEKVLPAAPADCQSRDGKVISSDDNDCG